MRQLKTWMIIIALSITQGVSTQTASAESCGTIKTRILNEEKVGKILWSEFQSIADDYGTRDKEIAITEAYVELLKSDTSRYSLASKNTKCFSSVVAVKIRKNYTLIQNWLKAQKMNLTFLNDPAYGGCDEEFCPTGGYYEFYLQYKSIYSLSSKTVSSSKIPFQLNG
jgi:hypothetical protein